MVDYFMVYSFKYDGVLIGAWAAIRMNTILQSICVLCFLHQCIPPVSICDRVKCIVLFQEHGMVS